METIIEGTTKERIDRVDKIMEAGFNSGALCKSETECNERFRLNLLYAASDNNLLWFEKSYGVKP